MTSCDAVVGDNRQAAGEEMQGATVPSASPLAAGTAEGQASSAGTRLKLRKPRRSYWRFLPGAAAWLGAAHWLYHTDLDHLRLFLIVSLFALVVYNLSGRRRRQGEKSAYAILNPDGAIDGDTSMAAFGLRDARRPAVVREAAGGSEDEEEDGRPPPPHRGGGVLRSAQRLGPASPASSFAPTPVLNVHPATTLGRFELKLCPRVFKGDGAAFKRYLAELATPSCKPKQHHKCPCGSGQRFAGCCQELQMYLRQSGYSPVDVR
jgi:hypothetical protein